MHQTVYIDAQQNTGSIDVSDQSLSSEELYNKIVEYKDIFTFSDIVPVSALKDDNIDNTNPIGAAMF